MSAKRTRTPTLISALRVLAHDIESADGVANAAIAEGADRIDELRALLFAASGKSSRGIWSSDFRASVEEALR